jgi:hypothetical protein
MAFDAQAPRVVLFGGSATSDTWVFTGGTWSQLNDTGPAPCEQTALVSAGATFLFGGVDLSSAALFGLTWELDGKNWTQRQDIGPLARSGHAMSFDADRSRIVLFGGNLAPPGQAAELVGDTWELPVSAPQGGQSGGGQPGQIVPTAITIAPDPAPAAQQVILTVTLSGPAPSGMQIVIGFDGNPNAGTLSPQAGEAQVAYAISGGVFTAGNHTMTATAGGVTVSTTFTTT